MVGARLANAGTVIIAGCAIVMTANHFLRDRTSSNRTVATAVSSAPAAVDNWDLHSGSGHARGSPAAKVTIVEYGDYECGYCGRVAPVLSRLLSLYPDDVRLIYRHWPLSYHRFAYPAAKAAECAGEQGRFWEMHDLLYQRQDSLGLLSFADLAERASVPDMSVFRQCNTAPGPVAEIERDLRLAELAGGTGTPTLLVNGMRVAWSVVDSSYIAQLLGRQD